MPVKKGLLLKDVTQIKNITQDISSSYGENPKSTFLRDASMATVPQGEGNVNYSLKGTETQREIACTEEHPPGLTGGCSFIRLLTYDPKTKTAQRGALWASREKMLKVRSMLKALMPLSRKVTSSRQPSEP